MTAVACALGVGIGVGAAGPALASSDHATVKVKDDCDPASFDAALNDPHACVGDGRTTFTAFLAEFAARKGTVEKWAFDPSKLRLDAGGTLRARNRGGEFHTFTEVKTFGGGCVPLLNRFEPTLTVPVGGGPLDCGALLATTGVAPGATLTTAPLRAGTHKFQCLIHSWMRITVKVRDHHDHGDDDRRGDDH